MEMLKSDLLKVVSLMAQKGTVMTPDEVVSILQEVKPDLEIIEDIVEDEDDAKPELVKLSDEQIETKNEIAKNLEKACGELRESVKKFNEIVVELESKQEAVNVLIWDVNNWLDSVTDELNDCYRSSSRTWRGSEEGAKYINWIENIENTFDDVGIDVPDTIDDWEISDSEEAAIFLKNLPESPEV